MCPARLVIGWLPALAGLLGWGCVNTPYIPVDAGGEPAADGRDAGPGDIGGDRADDDDGGGCLDAYPGQVLISEIMITPGAATGSAGRFIELYNNSFDPLKMEGWVIEDGAGGEAGLTLPVQVDFPPKSYIIVAFNGDPLHNGGLDPDLVIDGIDLNLHKLALIAGEVEVDRVDFRAPGWPLVSGASMNLDPAKYDLYSNDLAENWCVSSSTYGDGDLGTPGGANATCKAPECGDGERTYPEQCDDGNNGDDLDGCRDDCTFSCTNPAIDCGDVARDCQAPLCEPNALGQVCVQAPDDDDVPVDADECHLGVCHGGQPEQEIRPDGYTCDNGAEPPGDYCRDAVCIDPECGDDVKGPLEQCDDGNNTAGDGCSPVCEFEFCGNSQIDGDEQCDDGRNGNDLDGCRDDCLYTCSDPALDCTDTPGDCHGFECVAGGLGQVCSLIVDISDPPDDQNPCTLDTCDAAGNPLHDPASDGTECDNQQGVPGDYCVGGVCIDPVCGDGIEGSLEACDDGNFDCCDGCLPTCEEHTNTCGDGFTCPPEECDDENDQAGDGCTPGCVREVGTCPPDMVLIPADTELGLTNPYCMDRYEASRADATEQFRGTNVNKAVSQPGVIPWWSNPMTSRVLLQFETACQSAGKRICSREEFFAACTGPDRHTYVFGDVFDREICNCVDTFCDDYCVEHGISPCPTDPNCGYTYYSFHAVPTGSLPGCTNVYGTFDVTGNLWEIVPSDTDSRGYEVRGGAFNCAGASTRLQCTFNAGWTALYAGFRCCRDY